MTARKYTEDVLKPAVASCKSWAELLRYLGLQDAGGNRSNLKRRVLQYGISTDHFLGQGHNKGKRSSKRKHFTEYLVLLPEGSKKLQSDRLRRAMTEYGFIYQCVFDECPTRSGWINGALPYEIDHIDGNNLNNVPENLRFICANCHSQQPTSSHSWKNADKIGTKEHLRCSCGKLKSKSIYKMCGDCRLKQLTSTKS